MEGTPGDLNLVLWLAIDKTPEPMPAGVFVVAGSAPMYPASIVLSGWVPVSTASSVTSTFRASAGEKLSCRRIPVGPGGPGKPSPSPRCVG